MDSSNGSYNYMAPTGDTYHIELRREVLLEDVRKQKLDLMPGFRATWYYSGIEVKPWAKYVTDEYNGKSTKAFIRNSSILSIP